MKLTSFASIFLSTAIGINGFATNFETVELSAGLSIAKCEQNTQDGSMTCEDIAPKLSNIEITLDNCEYGHCSGRFDLSAKRVLNPEACNEATDCNLVEFFGEIEVTKKQDGTYELSAVLGRDGKQPVYLFVNLEKHRHVLQTSYLAGPDLTVVDSNGERSAMYLGTLAVGPKSTN